MNDFWLKLWNKEQQMFCCPWCERMLKSKMSTSVKNPNRTFVSCSKDHGGCGLFSFLDDQPNDSFNPNKSGGGQKRARTQGTNIMGAVVNQPGVHEQRLGELVAEVASLKSLVVEVLEYLKS